MIAGILVLDQFSVEQEPQTTLLPLLFAVGGLVSWRTIRNDVLED